MDLATARFVLPTVSEDDVYIQGTRRDGSAVLVGSVDIDHPDVAHEVAAALRALGVEVDDSVLPPADGAPAIHFMTMRCTVGPDDSDWTDLETRSALGKYPSASFAEEFDAVAEAVAALHPRPEPRS